MTASTSRAGPLIHIENLSRSFGYRRAVAGVDLSLSGGECLALFGPNGAGKTTLLRVLAGLLKPSGGRATIGGLALPAGPEARSLVGLIAHRGMLYDALTPRENVEFAARLHGLRDPRRAAGAALQRMRIDQRADTPVRALSRGMQQRVSIARAVVHVPRILLLDEPFSGLDDAGARVLSEMLVELRTAGTATVLVTHNLGEGLALATHAAIMRDGRFVRLEPRSDVDPATYAASYGELVANAG